MPSLKSPTFDGGSGQVHLRGLAVVARWLVAGAVIVVLGTVLGFLWFLDHVAPGEIALSGKADGIVVLTGGASRIEDAIELLARGNGRRLMPSA